MKYLLAVGLSIALFQCKVAENNATGNYWTDSEIPTDTLELPSMYRALYLDFTSLKDEVDNQLSVVIPFPNGTNKTVELKYSGTMSQELRKKFPAIGSYEIINSDHLSGRVDINSKGFFAMIIDLENTYFVNPITGNSVYYLTYDKNHMPPNPNNPLINEN